MTEAPNGAITGYIHPEDIQIHGQLHVPVQGGHTSVVDASKSGKVSPRRRTQVFGDVLSIVKLFSQNLP